MGQYASAFMVPEAEAVNKDTHPSKPNWITSHAIAAECKYNLYHKEPLHMKSYTGQYLYIDRSMHNMNFNNIL